MKNALFGAVALLFVGTLAWGITNGSWTSPATATTAVTEPVAVDPSPADLDTVSFFKEPASIQPFDITTIDGRTFTVGHAKVTIVNFWATWCPPCRAEIPDLIALQNKYPNDLQIIGVSEDEEGPDVVRRFVAEHKMNYPVAMSNDRIREVFPGVGSLPTSYIIDKDGRIMQRHIGMLSARLTELETRSLAGLAPEVKVARVEPPKPIGFDNGAQVTSIPGVDLASLSPEKRSEALRRLNTEGCTCGCGLTLARCRVDDPTCGVSLPAARKIVAAIAEE